MQAQMCKAGLYPPPPAGAHLKQVLGNIAHHTLW